MAHAVLFGVRHLDGHCSQASRPARAVRGRDRVRRSRLRSGCGGV